MKNLPWLNRQKESFSIRPFHLIFISKMTICCLGVLYFCLISCKNSTNANVKSATTSSLIIPLNVPDVYLTVKDFNKWDTGSNRKLIFEPYFSKALGNSPILVVWPGKNAHQGFRDSVFMTVGQRDRITLTQDVFFGTMQEKMKSISKAIKDSSADENSLIYFVPKNDAHLTYWIYILKKVPADFTQIKITDLGSPIGVANPCPPYESPDE